MFTKKETKRDKSKQQLLGVILIFSMLMASSIIVVVQNSSFGVATADGTSKTFDYKTQANPYSSWGKYRNISMNVTAGNTTPSGFQTLINVTYDSDMQADFDDLRFLDTDNETELDFWLEEKVDSTYALVWVQLNQIITSSNLTTCYMYYNNTGVSSASDMTATWNYSELWTTNHLTANYTYTDSGNKAGYYTTNAIETGIVSYRAIINANITIWDTANDVNTPYWGIAHEPNIVNDDMDAGGGNGSYLYIMNPDLGDGADATHGANRVANWEYSNKHSSGYTATLFDEEKQYLWIINAVGPAGAGGDTSGYMTENDMTKKWEDSTSWFSYNTSIYNSYSSGEDAPRTSHIYYDGSNDTLVIVSNESGTTNVKLEVAWMALGSYAEDCFPTYFIGPQQDVQEDESSVYTLKGLTGERLTWAGTAGNIVWCNTSGTGHEWLEINMSVNASQNVTDILVYLDDLNDTNMWINASNITMYCTNQSNGTYYSFGTFSDGGSNISLNQSQWETYAPALDNPFNSSGLTSCNYSFYCVFRLEIPSGLSSDEFRTPSTATFKVYLGHYV